MYTQHPLCEGHLSNCYVDTDISRLVIYTWQRRLAKVQTEHQNAEEMDFKPLSTC